MAITGPNRRGELAIGPSRAAQKSGVRPVCFTQCDLFGVNLPLALAKLGLIDEYEFVVQPRLVGHGPALFAGLSKPLDLRLVSRQELGSGAVAMRYEPRVAYGWAPLVGIPRPVDPSKRKPRRSGAFLKAAAGIRTLELPGDYDGFSTMANPWKMQPGPPTLTPTPSPSWSRLTPMPFG